MLLKQLDPQGPRVKSPFGFASWTIDPYPFRATGLIVKYSPIFKTARILGHYLFLVAHSFPRASFSKYCSLLGTDKVRGESADKYPNIFFSPNGDFCLYHSSLVLAEKRTVFRERSSCKSVSFEEQLMSRTNIRAYFRAKWKLLSISYPSNISRSTRIFENGGTVLAREYSVNVTRLDQSLWVKLFNGL